MESMLYPLSLIVVAFMAFTFFRSHNMILMAIALIVGVYIVYSHETGNTATGFKDSVIDDIHGTADEFSEKRGMTGSDNQKTMDEISGQ